MAAPGPPPEPRLSAHAAPCIEKQKWEGSTLGVRWGMLTNLPLNSESKSKLRETFALKTGRQTPRVSLECNPEFLSHLERKTRSWTQAYHTVEQPSPLSTEIFSLVHFSSVAQSCPTLCDPMNLSMPGLPVHHQLPEFTQTHVH